jgi:hypothetical protein
MFCKHYDLYILLFSHLKSRLWWVSHFNVALPDVSMQSTVRNMSPRHIDGYVWVGDCVYSQPHFEEQNINETLNEVKKTDVWCDLGYAWGCILTSNKCDLAFGNFGNYPHLDMMWHDVANSSP